MNNGSFSFTHKYIYVLNVLRGTLFLFLKPILFAYIENARVIKNSEFLDIPFQSLIFDFPINLSWFCFIIAINEWINVMRLQFKF